MIDYDIPLRVSHLGDFLHRAMLKRHENALLGDLEELVIRARKSDLELANMLAEIRSQATCATGLVLALNRLAIDTGYMLIQTLPRESGLGIIAMFGGGEPVPELQLVKDGEIVTLPRGARA